MFAVHIFNLIELPIRDKLKTTGRVQTSLKYFEEVYAHGKPDIVTKAYMRKSNILQMRSIILSTMEEKLLIQKN